MYSIRRLCIVLLAAAMAVSASQEDEHHGTPIQHGKEEHYKDGSHNVHFDHEAILGSYKLEDEFDELPAEEAQRRLGLLVTKMDADHDTYVSKDELSEWILMSFKLLDEEESVEEFEEKDTTGDGKLAWAEYLKEQYGYTEDEVKEFRASDRTDLVELLYGVTEDELKFETADLDKDGFLTRDEFAAFFHPYNYKHMHMIELQRTMHDNDKDKDGFISWEEYIGESADSDNKEWEIVERERFQEYDVNKDGVLSLEEIRPWVITDNKEEATEEAEHLITEADTDGDGKLSRDEIVDHHEVFVGSQSTDYGRYLHFVRHKDEL